MIPLTLACTSSDRTRPLMDGRFRIPGCDITFLPGEPEDIFRRALRDRAFDISELSMGSHIVTTARGDSPYVGVPVFLSRAFRHSAVYVRTDRGIRTATDLAGRIIGLPEYQQTAALWVRATPVTSWPMACTMPFRSMAMIVSSSMIITLPVRACPISSRAIWTSCSASACGHCMMAAIWS